MSATIRHEIHKSVYPQPNVLFKKHPTYRCMQQRTTKITFVVVAVSFNTTCYLRRLLSKCFRVFFCWCSTFFISFLFKYCLLKFGEFVFVVFSAIVNCISLSMLLLEINRWFRGIWLIEKKHIYRKEISGVCHKKEYFKPVVKYILHLCFFLSLSLITLSQLIFCWAFWFSLIGNNYFKFIICFKRQKTVSACSKSPS